MWKFGLIVSSTEQGVRSYFHSCLLNDCKAISIANNCRPLTRVSMLKLVIYIWLCCHSYRSVRSSIIENELIFLRSRHFSFTFQYCSQNDIAWLLVMWDCYWHVFIAVFVYASFCVALNDFIKVNNHEMRFRHRERAVCVILLCYDQIGHLQELCKHTSLDVVHLSYDLGWGNELLLFYCAVLWEWL